MEIRKWAAKHILRLNFNQIIDERDAMYKNAKFFEENWQKARKEANDLQDELGRQKRLVEMNEHAVKEFLQEVEALKQDPIRNRLGSIDLSQVHDPLTSLEETERKAYVGIIFSYRKQWKEEIEWLMKDQIEWWARNSLGGMFKNEGEQNAFARGNINFADLLLKRVEDLIQEYVQNVEEDKAKNASQNSSSAPLNSEAGLDILNLVNQVKV